MTQRYSQRRTNVDSVDPVPDSAHPIMVAPPRAIVRGPDGKTTWVARCPRCPDRDEESVITGTEESVRAQCPTCGTIVEVRDSGFYAASTPTRPPPKE